MIFAVNFLTYSYTYETPGFRFLDRPKIEYRWFGIKDLPTQILFQLLNANMFLKSSKNEDPFLKCIGYGQIYFQ